MLLFLDQDLANLFRHRKFAEGVALADAFAVGAHGVVLVVDRSARSIVFGILGQLHRQGGGVGHAAEVVDQLGDGDGVRELLGGVHLELLRDRHVCAPLRACE